MKKIKLLRFSIFALLICLLTISASAQTESNDVANFLKQLDGLKTELSKAKTEADAEKLYQDFEEKLNIYATSVTILSDENKKDLNKAYMDVLAESMKVSFRERGMDNSDVYVLPMIDSSLTSLRNLLNKETRKAETLGDYIKIASETLNID